MAGPLGWWTRKRRAEDVGAAYGTCLISLKLTTNRNANGHIAHASSDGDDDNDDDTNTLASPSCYRQYRWSPAARLARLAKSRHRLPAGTLRLLSQKQSVSFSILLVVLHGREPVPAHNTQK
jgi:hypothetical protein